MDRFARAPLCACTHDFAIVALTIIDLRRSGRGLVAACNECGHRSTLMATNPKLPPDLTVVEVRTKLACSACGSRYIQTYPQSWRSIRMAEQARKQFSYED